MICRTKSRHISLPCGHPRRVSRRAFKATLTGRIRAIDPNTDVTIRPARPEDAIAIAAIETGDRYVADQVRDEIDRGVSRVFVAEDETRAVVGWLSAWFVPPYELQVIQITVSPAKRRRGIGNRLLRTALDTYGASIEQAILEVREDNAAAIALYQKLGFVRLGSIRKGYYADGCGAVCMVWRRLS